MKKVGKQPGAYSLIFAFVMMTGIMLVASATIENTQNKVRYFNELEGSSKARLAAESAVDLALRDLRGYEAGYESSNSNAFCEYADPANPGAACQTSAEYQVLSLGTQLGASSRYFTPIPNTGDAAPFGECSILDNSQQSVNHSCNWNKLMVGQTINIPLYSVNSSNGDIELPSLDPAWTNWYLKVRTPCTNGSLANNCDGGSRYVLDGDSSDYANDDTIILWQLTALIDDGSPEGDIVSLVPNDEVFELFGTAFRDFALNTEVYESLINDPSINANLTGYIVLKAEAEDEYQPLYDLSVGDPGAIGAGNSLKQLALQLNIVSPLVEQFTGNSVPYLEWQLSTSGPAPFADNKTVIVGEGYYEGQSGTFYFPHVITQSSIDESATIYALGN